MSFDSEVSDSDFYLSGSSEDSDDEYDTCCTGGACPLNGRVGSALPFDPSSIQNIILKLADQFDIRVVMGSHLCKAVALTSGLALAGTLLGQHYGGKMGAAVGGCVGGACGVGIAAVAMRDVWEQVKFQLSELFDIVYDYLANLGMKDYVAAARFLMGDPAISAHLTQILVQVASQLLKKKITSTVVSASPFV